MNSKLRRFCLFSALSLSLSLTIFESALANVVLAKTSQRKITLTSFNIRFYGLSKEAIENRPTLAVHAPFIKNENRDLYLKDFLANKIPSSDLYIFQEIVDVPRLQNILPTGFKCLSYDHPSSSHQHVVLCHSPYFHLMKEPTDDNFLIDEVAGPNKNLRPALTAIVTDIKGNALFRLVGVHLKAMPDQTAKRTEQSKIISNYLSQLKNTNLPIIITGDFNTYPASITSNTMDDTSIILNSLNENELNMGLAPNSQLTFKDTQGYMGQFDHFYHSSTIKISAPLSVYQACRVESTPEETTLYNNTISDHCPVTARLEL